MKARFLATAVAALSLSTSAFAREAEGDNHYLYVWAGDRAEADKNFLAVIDADPQSPTYGQLVTSAATDQTSNNPHHTEYVMPASGKLFANDSDSYQYLAESIRKHPPQDELKAMMQAAGFARCDYRNLNAGIVAIHTGYKA